MYRVVEETFSKLIQAIVSLPIVDALGLVQSPRELRLLVHDRADVVAKSGIFLAVVGDPGYSNDTINRFPASFMVKISSKTFNLRFGELSLDQRR